MGVSLRRRKATQVTVRSCQIVETLTDSLTLLETPLTTKVARLMLASDILHNSASHVHNASRYRNLLEAGLPAVFESLQVGSDSRRALHFSASLCFSRQSRQSLSETAPLHIQIEGVGCLIFPTHRKAGPAQNEWTGSQ